MEQKSPQKTKHENKFDVTVIPFNYRKSPLLSISFLSFELEMGQFKIMIESDGESSLKTPIISQLCEITMVPKFQIDYINKDINFLNTTTYPKYIISLLDINNNEKMKFCVNLLELSFLGKDLFTVSIYHYPMLIFEFMDGYYSTTELFQKNDLLLNENISKRISSDSNIEDNLNMGNYLDNTPEVDYSINSINDEDIKSPKNDRNASVITDINPDIIQKINSNLANKEEALGNTKNRKGFIRGSCFIDNNDLKKYQNKEATLGSEKKRKGIARGSCFIDNNDLKKYQNKEGINNKFESEKENKKDKYKKSKNKKKLKKNNKEIKEKKIDTYCFSEYFDLYLEKILFFRDELIQDEAKEKKIGNNLINKNENVENILKIYKRNERINQIKKEKEFYINKEQDINNIKQKIKIIISNKQDLLTKLNKGIVSHRIKYNELNSKNINLIPMIVKQQLIYDSFLNKKIAEICLIFFNKKIKSLYFQDFFKNSIKSDNNEYIKNKIEFYNNNKKKISSTMGYITQLMIYMSKCFDIPLRYPLLLNGAKSFIIKEKKDKEKDFLPLHCDLKRDDKFWNFESGLNYLKNDFKEIIKFCSMYPEIITENEFNKYNIDNDDYSFFKLFITFNHCLCDFIKNIQKMFEFTK